MFITFEGIEGCGKTTQAGLIKSHLEKAGRSVLSLREPGGTPLGELIRPILLSGSAGGISSAAELFLYEACRAQIVSNVIRPALTRGEIVICDRFTDSTIAYQGYGRNLSIEDITNANQIATGGLKPDLTIIMDLPVGVGLKRAWSRINNKAGAREDRFEKEDAAFHERVRDGFLRIAAADGARVRVVDATLEIPSIHKEICDIMDVIMR